MSTQGKILIVDDEEVVRDSLRQWFSAEGYDVTCACCGKEALCNIAER